VGNRLSRDDGIGPEVARILVDSDWVAAARRSRTRSVSPPGIGRISLWSSTPRRWASLPARSAGSRSGRAGRRSPQPIPSPYRSSRIPIRSSRATLSSTHSLSLPFVLDRMKGGVGQLILIGVEPADLSLGEGLSPPLSAAATELARILLRNRVDPRYPPLRPSWRGSSYETGSTRSPSSRVERPAPSGIHSPSRSLLFRGGEYAVCRRGEAEGGVSVPVVVVSRRGICRLQEGRG